MLLDQKTFGEAKDGNISSNEDRPHQPTANHTVNGEGPGAGKARERPAPPPASGCALGRHSTPEDAVPENVKGHPARACHVATRSSGSGQECAGLVSTPVEKEQAPRPPPAPDPRAQHAQQASRREPSPPRTARDQFRPTPQPPSADRRAGAEGLLSPHCSLRTPASPLRRSFLDP